MPIHMTVAAPQIRTCARQQAAKALPAIALAIAFVTAAPAVHAFGVGDLISMGVQAGGKLVGAAVDAGVDKVKDAMRDPQAEENKKREEERRVAEAFQKAQADIEARRELSPLQREKACLALHRQYAQLQQFQRFAEQAQAQQQARRVAERDQLFTGAGILGTVGSAAMNTPSMMMAQADVLARSPGFRAQSADAIRQADRMVAAGVPQAQTRMALAQVDATPNKLSTAAGIQAAVQLTQALSTPPATVPGAEIVSTPAPLRPPVTRDEPTPSRAVETTRDAFSPDMGKKLYVEFVGSSTETKAIRTMLTERGHTLLDSKDDADVTYLMEGEYVVAETKEREGVDISVGKLLDNPTLPIEPPQRKLMGSVRSGFGMLMLGMAAAQGAQIPAAAVPKESKGFRQTVLLVTARQPKGAAETRISVLKEVELPALDAATLSRTANEEMRSQLGLVEVKRADNS